MLQAPVAPIPWSYERNVTLDPSPCVQFSTDSDSGTSKLIGQEDCLFLNVFKPKVSNIEEFYIFYHLIGAF